MHSSDAPLSQRELLVLAVLADEPLHGYGLVKAVEVRSEGSVVFDPTNLYRMLKRMQGSGWIEEVQHKGYTRRRTYKISHLGRAMLRVETERLAQLLRNLRHAGSRL